MMKPATTIVKFMAHGSRVQTLGRWQDHYGQIVKMHLNFVNFIRFFHSKGG